MENKKSENGITESIMSKITINQDLCSKCNICVEICPFSIFNQLDNDSIPTLVNDELCVSCGHCIAICPSNAISHIDFPNGSIKPVDQKIIPSVKQILELIRSRRSIRVFKYKSVEKEKIERIIQGACFAPSANNIQSTQFVVVQNKDTLNEITKLTVDYLKSIVKKLQNPILKPVLSIFVKNKIDSTRQKIPDYVKIINAFDNGNDLIIHNAPVLIFFYAEKNIGFSDVNANLALQNATFTCQTLGLGCFYAGYVIVACRHDRSVQNLLNIPITHCIYGCLAIGYPKFEFKNWIQRKSSKIEWL